MIVKVKTVSDTARLPVYATEGAAAADIFADLNAPAVIGAGPTVMIPTGLTVELESGHAMFLYARSGLAAKNGVTLANCVGIIDSDYRGEIKVALHNISNTDYTVRPGDRIAQAAVAPVSRAKYVLCGELGETARGAGGFGSTGKSGG